MDLGLRGKRALVMGASRGLGRAIAETLAAEGCDLVVGARDGTALSELCERLGGEHGVSAEAEIIDMTDSDSVAALAGRVGEDIKPDILINNSGGPPPSGPIGVDDEVWQASARSLLFGVIRLTEAAVPAMRERRWGRILTIASSGVVQPIPHLAVSNTIRPAIAGFSKSLSNEVGPDGITVNVILPGRIATDRTKTVSAANAKRRGITVEEVLAASQAEIPLRRYGRPEEFAKVAAFLVSEAASYVTGHMMRVDGGVIRSV